MKMGFALVGLSACAAIPAAAQRASEVHHWAPLVRNAADLVDIDTAAVRTRDGIHEVWLRWSAAMGAGIAPPDRYTGGMVSVYSIERREIDCIGGRTRLLQDEVVGSIEPGTVPRAGPQPEGRLVEWYRPAPGSLVALAVRALCERVGQAGA